MPTSALIDRTPVGTAGTLIAAGLETAGHYMQSQMLDVFRDGVGTSLGSLLTLIAVVGAVFTLAVGGNYKFGIWFLVGPVVFYGLTLTRVPSTGVIWQFGSRVHDGKFVDQAVTGIVDREKPINVSWFFAKWNKLVSLTVRSMTEVVRPRANNGDLNFINHTTRYLGIFEAQIDDERLQEFVRLVTFNPRCLAYYNIQFKKGAEDTNAIGNQDKLNDVIDKQLAVQTALTRTDKAFGLIEKLIERRRIKLGTPISEINGVDVAKDRFTCAELWKLTIPAIEEIAIDYLSTSISTRLADGQDAKILYKDLASKFKDPDQQNKRYMYLLHAIMGRMIYNTLINVRPEFQKYYNKNRLSSYKYENTHTAGPAASNRVEHYNDPMQVNELLNWWSASTAGNRKGEILNFVQGFPYLQGVILYFLALTFPFFALAVVIPGRHHAIFLWMGLWMWVKTWDFGLALVMRVEAILYDLLPSGPKLDNMDEASTVFQIIASGDPTYAIYAYHHIMAALIGAIPIVSGILVKKGGGDVVSAIGQGYKDFAGHMGESLQSYTAGTMSFERMNAAENHIQEAGENSYKESMKDERVLTALDLWRGNQVANEALLAGIDKGDGQAMQKVAHAMNNISSDRQRAVIDQVFKTNAAIAMSDAANSEYSNQLTRYAVMTGWASHSKIDKYDPVGDIISLGLTEENYKYAGGIANTLHNKKFHGVLGTTPGGSKIGTKGLMQAGTRKAVGMGSRLVK